MEGWCQTMEREAEENDLPEESKFSQRFTRASAEVIRCCFLFSSWADSKCSWQRPDAYVSEGPAVFPPLSTKSGECVIVLIQHKTHSLWRTVLSTGAAAISWHAGSLCGQDPSAYPQPSSQDLANFWDLLQLNIEDVRIKFQDLQRMKDSGWRLPPEKKVRGSGLQTALQPLQLYPRAKMAMCRRAAQMAVPSEALEAVKMQNSMGIWPELQDILNLYKCKCISGAFTYFLCSDWLKHSSVL